MSSRFSAVLLAGGKSTRMGRDKAFIEIGGVPLWRRQLRTLEQLAPAELFLAGHARAEWQDAACTIIPDAQEDSGPLAGIVSALRRSSSPLLLVLAVDLPNITRDDLQRLLDLCTNECGVVPRTDRFEPLVAAYPTRALSIAEQLLSARSYSLQEFARHCVADGLAREHHVAPADRAPFFNMNTPEQLALAAADNRRTPSRAIDITRHDPVHGPTARRDNVAVEEPLEIRVEDHSVAVVMRTPGHDRELAAGFLLTENLIRSSSDIFDITQCGTSAADDVVNVALRDPRVFDPAKLTRNVFSSSSCGICSKATIDAVRQTFPPIDDDARIASKTIFALPTRLRAQQETFERTGGLHACAIFDAHGEMQLLREDVGRHNALDKLIGRALLDDQLPLCGRVLFLSGRVSFEMMQKALAAGVPIVAAISAPTSLAVEFARESNQTLVGFVRGETMNIYAGSERISGPTASAR
ncbi:MAG TPA: formate dehydrogenase accessory sulfurtransferase FdhD [Chthoniobacterales bacterium]